MLGMNGKMCKPEREEGGGGGGGGRTTFETNKKILSTRKKEPEISFASIREFAKDLLFFWWSHVACEAIDAQSNENDSLNTSRADVEKSTSLLLDVPRRRMNFLRACVRAYNEMIDEIKIEEKARKNWIRNNTQRPSFGWKKSTMNATMVYVENVDRTLPRCQAPQQSILRLSSAHSMSSVCSISITFFFVDM